MYHSTCCVDGEWKLLLVSHASSVGVLPHGGEVFCIERIAIIPLTADPAVPEVIGLEVLFETLSSATSITHHVLGVGYLCSRAAGA